MTPSRHRGRTRRTPSRGSRLFKLHRDAWWESAAFERRDQVTGGGSQWTIVYKIHARRRPAADGALEFQSSITVWPETAPRRRRASSGRDDTVSAWRRRLDRTLRQNGYSGGWDKSPQGRFGDFWKTLPSAAAVAVEIKRLERLRLSRRLAPGH